MAEVGFLGDLAIVFIAAAVTTVLFYRLKQPVVLGYIAAGIILSPHTPPAGLTVGVENVQTISEIGLVFLLFSLGLEWSLGAVRKLGPGLLLATPLEVVLMTAAGYGLGLAFGWTPLEALLLGAALSISSTVIILKTLTDLGQLDTTHGRTALGVNVVEDLIAVAIISQIPAFLGPDPPGLEIVAGSMARLVLFVAVMVAVGYVIVPRLVGAVARFHVSDVLVVTLVGFAFGIAILAESLGFAAGFGAFLAGFLIAGSERLHEVRARVEPLRDVFGAVFFVSIGLLVDPAVLLDAWPLVLGGALVVLLVKPAATTLALVMSGRRGTHAARSALFLVPIGEMGFVIAGAAAAAGRATSLLTILTGIALVTALAGPLVGQRAERITKVLSPRVPRPVVRLSRQYAQWSGRLSRRALPDPGYRRAITRRGWRAALNIGIVVALFGIAAWVPRLTTGRLGLAGAAVPTVALTLVAAAVLSVPPLVFFMRNAREVHGLVTQGMTPERFWARPEERSVVGRVVRDTVGAALLLLVSVLVLLSALPFFSAPPVLVVFGLLLLGAMLFFFDAALALHMRLQNAVEAAFTAGIPIESRREVEDMLASQYPWGVVFEEATVGPGSRVAGRPLGELRVRGTTGATVVSIKRGERTIVNPGPDQMIVVGDQVLLAGEPSQVVQARDLLAGAPAFERRLDTVGAQTLECEVPRGSSVAGQSLRKANLRAQTGAVVLALVRGGRVVSHPGPDEVLHPGDRLLLVGTGSQLDKARELLGAAPSDRRGEWAE